MRLALFGGTFDPPHRGHVALARAAADHFTLDRVLFAPVGRQPLKTKHPMAPFPARLAMVELVCRADPRFRASLADAPLEDGAPNYTVDTLRSLRREHPLDTLFALAGADSFRTFSHWREPEELLRLVEWIVVSRPGFPLAEPESLVLSAAQRARIHALDTVHEDVSATTLRARLAAGETCAELLPAGVAEYIQTHRLYVGPGATIEP